MKKVVIITVIAQGKYEVRVDGRTVLEGGTLEEALAAVGEAVPRPEKQGHEPH